mgnify:FL=1
MSPYRPAVEGLFAPTNLLAIGIPLIWPDGGRISSAVAATYDAATQQAALGFTESCERDLASYQICGIRGLDYDKDDELVLTTILKGAPRTFRTTYPLPASGTVASF